MMYNEVSFSHDEEENMKHNTDIPKSTEYIFSDIDEENERALIDTIIKCKNNKPNIDWSEYDCGGKDCHGTSECKPNDCKCVNRTVTKNFPMLHSLCKAMIQFSKPHRLNNQTSWSNFQEVYFSRRQNENPTMFRNTNSDQDIGRLGKFLQHEWYAAKALYLRSLQSKETETPFLRACAEVIEDKNNYEREVQYDIINNVVNVDGRENTLLTQATEDAIQPLQLTYRSGTLMTVKSLKTFHRNCIGSSAVTDYEKYLDDQIINLCMLEDLDTVELAFSEKCRVLYATFYSSITDGRPCSFQGRKSIFISEYLFFPIGKSLHWSLCIVCHPLYFLIKEYAKFFEEAEKELFRNILDSNYTSCIIFLDSLPGSHDYQQIVADITLFLTQTWKKCTKKDGHKNSAFAELVSGCISNDQYQAFAQWMAADMELYADDPAHNIFTHMRVIDDRLGLIQDNFYDCGYYVTLNFKEFVSRCATIGFETLIATDRNTFQSWFTHDDVVNKKRGLLQRLMGGLPTALKEPDREEHLANIWTYLRPEYDAQKKRERTRVMEGMTTLLSKRKAAKAVVKELDIELDTYCQTHVKKLYSSRQKCEDDRTTIKKAFDASHEGDAEKMFREILDKSFPEQNGGNEYEENMQSQSSQSSSAFLMHSQSSIASDSMYTASPDSTSPEPIKRRTSLTRQSKNTKTVTKRSQEDEDIYRQTTLSNCTEEFISQHEKPLFMLFYPETEHAESSVLSSKFQHSTRLRDHNRSALSSAMVGAAIAAEEAGTAIAED